MLNSKNLKKLIVVSASALMMLSAGGGAINASNASADSLFHTYKPTKAEQKQDAEMDRSDDQSEISAYEDSGMSKKQATHAVKSNHFYAKPKAHKVINRVARHTRRTRKIANTKRNMNRTKRQISRKSHAKKHIRKHASRRSLQRQIKQLKHELHRLQRQVRQLKRVRNRK